MKKLEPTQRILMFLNGLINLSLGAFFTRDILISYSDTFNEYLAFIFLIVAFSTMFYGSYLLRKSYE